MATIPPPTDDSAILVLAPVAEVLKHHAHTPLLRMLCEADVARAARFVRAEDRRRYVAARLALVHGLEAMGMAVPRPLMLHNTPHGKPFLPDLGLHFNWSHSGSYVALAFHVHPVGVDIEQVGELDADTARHVTNVCEAEWIRHGGQQIDWTRFFQLWTAKESALKADGIGFGVEPHEVGIVADAHAPRRWSAQLGQPWYGQSWLLEGAPAYWLSVCTGQEATRFRMMKWEELGQGGPVA